MRDNQNTIPEDWELNELGSVCSIKKGVQFSKVDLSKDGDYPCINGGIDPSGYSKLWNRYENTITISEGGNSCGYVNFLTTKFWCGGHCYSLLDLDDKLENDFLYQALKGRQDLIMDLRVGSGLPNIQQKAIKKFEFLSPKSKAEQTQIASILSKADEAISNTEQLIAKYTRIKTGLMQDLLTRGIDEQGNIRSEETHEFKNERGFVYPAEWSLTTIDKCTNGIEQGWSPSCDSDPAPINQWGILKTTAVSWNGFNETENKQMPKNLTPKAQYEVKQGDVLITRAGPNSRVGVVAFVNETRQKLIFSDKIYRLSPKENIINRYLALALSSQFTQRHLSNFKTGMAESQTNISQKIVLALNILVPSPKEQKRIVQKIEKTEEFLKVLIVQLSKIQSLKTGLMQDLLNGTVRVNHLIKEMANL